VDVTPDDVTLATELVVEAAALAARIRSEDDLETRSKTSVSDIVTAADLAAERHIVERLGRARPEDGLLGEGKRLRLIRDVEPVLILSSEHAESANPITVLSRQLDSLT